MKKLFSFALVILMIFALAVPAMAVSVKYNENQDFTEPVTVTTYDLPWAFIYAENPFTPEGIPIFAVPVGQDIKIPISFTNNADRACPQLSIWVNFEQSAYWGSVGKGETVEYILDIDTSEVGTYSYYVEIWTRMGNPNYEDLGVGAAIFIVYDSGSGDEKSDGEIAADLLKSLSAKDIANNLALKNGSLILTAGGKDFVLAENAKNFNQKGESALGDGYYLIFDIAGNGTNIKQFDIIKK